METTPKSPETPPAAKPRNKNLVLIGIVVIVLIVVGVGAYYLFNGGTTTPGTPVTIWDTNGACLQTASPPDCGFKTSTGSTTLNVTSGTKVTWTNTGGSPHTATSCDQAQVTTYGTTACATTNSASVDAFASRLYKQAAAHTPSHSARRAHTTTSAQSTFGCTVS